MPDPRLHFESGTAYDMLVSLIVLHDPGRFGVRGAWAAGMRSRLPAPHREFLEEVQNVVVATMPLNWLHSLPEPRDGATLLWALDRMPPAERLPAVALRYVTPAPMADILRETAARGAWSPGDANALWAVYDRTGGAVPAARRLMPTVLRWWADAAAFGERYLDALRVYYEVFFKEEERRIGPMLQQGQAEARLLADRLSLPRLLENLSQGVRFAVLPDAPEYILAPSFWSSPLLFHQQIDPQRWMFLFGARPSSASLVPGEAVPDALVLALKALGDPTRLRILRYLSRQMHTPTQLARRLRLRTPTVIYHLNTLRMAGLVVVMVGRDQERGYAARGEQVEAIFHTLSQFLATADDEEA